jgi:YVTN family beta-propeller protein
MRVRGRSLLWILMLTCLGMSLAAPSWSITNLGLSARRGDSVPSDPDGNPVAGLLPVEIGRTVVPRPRQGGSKYDLTEVDPGEPPEGDYLGWAAFTPDGGRILLTNRMTDNVTVFDWATMAVLANVDVGTYPSGIAVSDTYAVVCCSFSDEVYVIRLSDYSVAGVFPTGEQPWVARVSADGTRAYVSCDIDDVCEVIDLEALSHVRTISNFPIALATWSYISENARNAFGFTDFEITPGGGHLVTGGYRDSVFFFNAQTGAVDYVVAGITDCSLVELSGDGAAVVALSSSSPPVVHQIDLSSHTLIASVPITGYSLGTQGLGVNDDGSKAFIGISNNSSAIARFATLDFTVLTQTYTPFWIGTSPDRSLAIGGQYRFSLVDFATESVVGQYVGITQSYGTVSPVGSRVASYDPLRHEGLYFYDYTTPGSPSYRGTTNSGEDPEGDAPRRVAITPNGTKAVVSNVLSDNATIVDMATAVPETIIFIGDRAQDVAVTSDSRWAVVCGMESNSVKVVDLLSNTVAADVPTASRPAVVSITPDDSYAYIGNISSNTVSIVQLAGAASTEVAELPCGVIGALLAGFHVCSDVRVNPSGQYALVAVSFDDQVKVIDTSAMSVVATLSVGDFPLQIAFNAAGDYAVVTNYLGDSYSVIHVEGASSSVVGTFSQGQGPLRLAYNPVDDVIGIGHYGSKTLVNVVPETGAFVSSTSYASYGNVLQVVFDENGSPLVLTAASGSTPAYLHSNDGPVQLTGQACYFDYCPATRGAVAVTPGPDIVSVVSFADTEAPTVPGNPRLAVDGTLSWSPSYDNVGVDHYRVYRRTMAYFGTVGLLPVATTADTSAQFPGSIGDPTVNYYFRVTARDAAGNESPPSATVGEFDYEAAAAR